MTQCFLMTKYQFLLGTKYTFIKKCSMKNYCLTPLNAMHLKYSYKNNRFFRFNSEVVSPILVSK